MVGNEGTGDEQKTAGILLSVMDVGSGSSEDDGSLSLGMMEKKA